MNSENKGDKGDKGDKGYKEIPCSEKNETIQIKYLEISQDQNLLLCMLSNNGIKLFKLSQKNE